ncbi:hypothetical protein PG989_016364 [Apiospora arundinis]
MYQTLFWLLPILAIWLGWTAFSAYCLYCNYLQARKIGVPIRVIPIDHLNKAWLLVDRQVIALVRRLPWVIGKNSFTRFNYRGWHEDDGTRAHDEMGDAFVLVTPSRNWLYIADPDALMDMYRRGKDFPRWVEITKMLDVFGGPNIATATGEQWKTHRKLVNAGMNEQCNAVVWSEAASLGDQMARYWATKRVFTSVGEDSRTVSLHILCKACFGQSFPFEGHEDREDGSVSASFRFSLVTIMENALLILALQPGFFMRRWLPLPAAWKRVGMACKEFKCQMARMYTQKLQALTMSDAKEDMTLMDSLVRTSQKGEVPLTESEIYGTLFVVSFAGHDTTAHLLTFSIFFLAANPSVQDWLAQELHHVLGDRPTSQWVYRKDFPRLRRCLAILYETLRLKTPVAEAKWNGSHSQCLSIHGQMLHIPPGTLLIPSYIHVHNNPRIWGRDAREWKPERWIMQSSGNNTGNITVSNSDHYIPGQNTSEDRLDTETTHKSCNIDQERLLLPPSRGAYLGWSEGSRDCPGKKFSHVEWVAVLAALFRDWRVEPVQRQDETSAESQTRVLDFVASNTGYGGLLLQLLHPERLPLVWTRRT